MRINLIVLNIKRNRNARFCIYSTRYKMSCRPPAPTLEPLLAPVCRRIRAEPGSVVGRGSGGVGGNPILNPSAVEWAGSPGSQEACSWKGKAARPALLAPAVPGGM